MIIHLIQIKDNFEEFKINLMKNFKLLQMWLYENHMVLNPGKCDNSNKKRRHK